MTKITQNSKLYSFEKGFSQVARKDLRNVRKEIMAALGLFAKSSWYHRLYGQVEPKFTEIKSIESIFAKYGITEVWGENK